MPPQFAIPLSHVALQETLDFACVGHHVVAVTTVRAKSGHVDKPSEGRLTGNNDTLVRWVLWSKGRAVVSHDSAAGAYGFGPTDPDKVHLTVMPEFRMKDSAVVLHRRRLTEGDITALGGAAITTVVRTVLDMIESHADSEMAGAVVRDALDSRQVTVRQIARRLDELDDDARRRAEQALRSPGW